MRLILSAIAILVSSGGTSASAQPRDAAVDIEPFIAQTISPQVHLLSVPDDYVAAAIGNVIVIEQSKGVVLVDSGANITNGRKIAAYVRSLTSKPIVAVIVSHWHPDHPEGIAGIRESWPNVRVIATPGTKAGMLGPGLANIGLTPSAEIDKKMFDQLQARKEQFGQLLEQADVPAERKERARKGLTQIDSFSHDFQGSYVVLPTDVFTSVFRLPDPKIPIEVHYFGRANTEGDAITWLPKQKIVASGDVVASPIPFGFGSYPADWSRTLKRLEALKFMTLLPGHGAAMYDRKYVDQMIASIAAIRSKVGAAVNSHLSFKELKANVDLTGEAARFGKTPFQQAMTGYYWVDPMRINAYKEAKGMPILQLATIDPDPE